jgi:DNA polymerase-4
VKTIFHVDMDAFFVSVEELYDPSLRGKPVVVGGSSEQRGVVSAASYAARKFGVHSAMPLRTAHQLCPQAIFVEGHPDRYRKYSNLVREVLGQFTPQVEMASIDEAYLDMTGTERLHGPPLLAAHKLHNAIREATGLNNSIGAGTSRLLAKICSDQAKPHGIVWIPPGAEAAFLAPLAVRKIPGVGKVTEQKLHRLGIRQVGDLAALDAKFLAEHLGEWGLALAGKSKGLDAGGWFQGEIGAEQNPKSISHEHTFSVDTADSEALEAALAHLSEKVGRRLREHGLWARTIQLKLRYSDFSTFTRALTLGHATQIDTEIYQTARELLRKNRRAGAAIRLLGVQTSGLSPEAGQLDLLEGAQQERMGRALSAMDKLRDKYGEGSVSLALGLQGRFKERTHEALPNAPDKTAKPKK